MKKTFFTGLSSLLLPLGLYGVPTQAAVGYQRSYLGAGMITASTHGSIDVLTHARELITHEAVASDELDIVNAVPVNELVVIDAAVPDKHALYRNIKPGLEIVELDANTEGLAQLTNILQRYKNLSALHIISHAEDGILLLGNSRVDTQVLQREVDIFNALNGALVDGADLLFYGCNLAKGEAGEEFLNILQANTKLDLAASNDLTGAGALDGDWDLEIHAGHIETQQPFSDEALKDFVSVLQLDQTITMDGFPLGYGEPKTTTYGAYTARLSLDDGDPDGNSMNCINGYGYGYQCIVDYSGGSTGDQKFYFDFTDGETFDVTSLYLYTAFYVDQNLRISSDKGDTIDANVLGDGTGDTIALNWTGITRITIEKVNGSDIDFLRIDDIVLTNIEPANNAPTATGIPSDITVTEDTASNFNLSSMSFADADGDSLTVTLAAGAGTFAASSGGGVTVGGSGTGTLTLAGTVANINTYLDTTSNIQYTGASNSSGNDATTVTVNANDGTVNPLLGTINVDITAVNDAPSATNLTQSKSATEGGGAVALDDIVITDPDVGDTVTATLTLSNTAAGTLSTGIFGSATSAFNAGVWTVTGSVSDVNAALAAVAFTPSANNDQNFTITTRIRDAADTGPADGTISVTVTGVNDAPSASNLTQSKSATEDGSTVALDDIVITDPDAGDTMTATLTLSSTAAGTLSTGIFGSATSTFNAGLWTVTGSVSDVNAALAAVAFTPSANNDQNFTITTRIRDAADTGPADGTISVTVTGVNDAPSASNLTQSKSATEDGSTVALDDIVITDPDAGDTMTATLTLSSTAAGTLSTGTFGSATSAFNAGTGVWTVTGSVSDVNAALAAVAFTPSENNDQNFTITTRVRDAEGTGPADGTITVTVTGVNDEPTDITLSNASVSQSATASGVDVGTLTTDDADGSDSHTYSLVSTGAAGSGSCASDSGNASFQINGSTLETASELTSGSYNLCIQTSDGTATYKEGFVVTVSDDVSPTVSSVTSSTADGTYGVGDTLAIQVNFSEAVTVTGTPQLTLETGATGRTVNYASGSGSSSLTFNYTIQAGDNSSDLDYTATNALALSGGTINDSAANAATLTLASPGAANSLSANNALVVDGTAPTVSSVDVPANATYTAGQNLDFTVNTSENVTVDTTGGTPRIALTIGATTRYAEYVSGGGTTSLLFRHTVLTGDSDANGIAVGSLDANSGTLRDAAGNDLGTTLNSVGSTAGVLVDASAPTVSSVSVPANETYAAGENLDFTVNTSENVTVDTSGGTPRIALTIGATTRYAGYISGSGTTSLVFRHTVLAGDSDADGVAVGSLDANSGTLRDAVGNNLDVTLNSVGATGGVLVDAVGPTASIVVDDDELLTNETSLVTITFNEAVTGFDAADLEVVNGTLGALTTGDNITWTATFTPDPDIYELNNIISLDNTGVVDAAGNTGSGTTDSNEFTIRTQALTLLVTSNLDTDDDETTAASLADDETDGNGLSLREALFWARSNGDTITFDLDSGTAGNQGGTILLNGNPLAVNQNNLTINGDLDDDSSPDVTLSGGNLSLVMSIAMNTSDVELTGLTLTEGSGGGLQIISNASVTVRDAHITDNSGGGFGDSGGGIFGNGSLIVINSTVSNNVNASSGGGISINGGVLHVINSTISNNLTTGTEVTGGGIRYTGPDLLLVNTTISGNQADDSQAEGGGLSITSGSFAAVYNSTIVGNASTNVGGGVLADGTNDIFVNTVIAGNTAGAGATAAVGGSPLATGGAASDVIGTIEVATNSFFGTNTAITTDTNSLNYQGTLNLLLGDLADNGGMVMTHLPMNGSALSDAGSTAALPVDTYDLNGDTNVAEALPVDALGASRVSGAAVDIGAVEGNRAPVLLDLSGGNTYIEDGVAVVMDNDVTVTDDELDGLNGGNGNYNGASVTIARNGGADASDTFGFMDGSGMSLVEGEIIKNGQVIATFDTATAGQLVVTYTDANGEVPERSDVNAMMQQITYANTSNDPDTNVVLDWTFADETGAPDTETASVTISLKNDAPVVTATGGTPTFTEGGTAVDLLSAVSISPVEAAQSIISLQLTVTGANNGSDEILAIDGSDVALTQGNALVTATNGLDVTVAVAGTTATVTLSHATGITGAAAQAVVDGMTYRNTSENPNPLSRVVTLSSVQDNGGVANGGADTASLSIAATVTISAVNNAPTISGTPATVTDQNAPYSFTPSAADVDSDTLTFSIANQPAWANFDDETGTLSGVPSQANVGVTSNIVITVSDGDMSTNLPAFNLTVMDVNDAPVINGTPVTSLDQDTAYLFTPTASDLDGDDLTFSIANQPAWASFDPATGTLAGTPDVDDVGVYANIVITVSDGALTTDLPSFSIEVLATNVAPEISGTPPLTAYVGAAYSFTPTASDADDDELTFSAIGLPTWLTLDTATGQLSGTPAAADADMSYNIALSVSDGIETATLPVFSLSVEYDGAEPVVTPPEDITINAIGLYTPITLRQLLSLPPGTSAAAVQEALGDLASDSTGGEDCCVTEPQGLLANLILLPPGRHEIVWRATNPDGLNGEAVQVVNVRPRVAFGKHQVAVEDTSVQVRVILNGRSPFYPLEVPYVIDPASTALLGIDHDAMDGSVTFTEGQTEVSFTVNLLAGGTAGDTRLIIRLDDSSPRSHEPIPNYDPANPDIRDINAGAADQHFINIVDGNVIPKVSLVMNQSGADTILVGAGSGPVTATAVVTDPNPGDTHSFNWAGTDSRLSDTDGSATNNTFVFDPAGQVGLRKLEVVTTDSAGGVDTSHLHFLILPSLPTLDAGTDTDEDGVDDLTEGTSDTNSNGIPDYLDNMPSSNVLPQVIISTTSYLIECDPGVLCGIGQFALGGDSGGVQILNDKLGVTEGLVADEDFEPAGGIFDFVIRDLPTAGQSVRIVIPQQAPIPANAVYRKFQQGEWVNFIENADNTLHSAPGNPGYCPPPGDDTWAPGLVEGYLCVQLNIQDGGPNDADGVVNSAIADPGAVSSAKPVAPPPPPPPPPATSIDSKGKGGGALDWTWILLGGVLLVLRRYGSKKPAVLLLVVALFSGASQAQAEAGDTYLRLNVYQAQGDQSASDCSNDMAGDGVALSLRDYDVSRVAYRLSIGYQWSEATSVELGYMDLGDVTVNFDTTATDMAALTRALEEHYPMSADGFTLSHRFGHHFTSGLSLSGEVGIFMWDGKIDVDGAAIDPDLGSGIDPLLGVQLDYRLAEPVSVGLGYQRIFFDGQAVDLMGVSGIWHF